jgi:hypothetical protein
MSDGITLYCPFCRGFATKKEYDYLKVKLKEHSLKHPDDDNWYESTLPVYTCEHCGKQMAIELVNK